MRSMRFLIVTLAVGLFVASGNIAPAQVAPPRTPANSEFQNQDWPVYGGTLESTHYSSLAQINRANVAKLKVAWVFDSQEDGGLQTNPIVIDGILYAYTPSQKVIALDAATGNLLWKF